MRKRILLRAGYIVVLVVILLFCRATRKESLEGSFYINDNDVRELVITRLGEPDFVDQVSGEMVWFKEHLLVRFEMRVLFDPNDLPNSVLLLRHIGPSWAEWTLVSEDYRRYCSDFQPEEDCP